MDNIFSALCKVAPTHLEEEVGVAHDDEERLGPRDGDVEALRVAQEAELVAEVVREELRLRVRRAKNRLFSTKCRLYHRLIDYRAPHPPHPTCVEWLQNYSY